MNKGVTWLLVVVALLVGLYAGYAYEKNKMDGLMMSMQSNYQQQLNAAKTQPTGMMSDVVMMSKTGYATDPKGMSLYTFDNDKNGMSSCYGACASLWPAYTVSGTVPATLPAHLGTTKRTDGSMQYTWDGKPLYYYAKDTKTGDTMGDGIGGVWHLAK